MKYTPHNYQQVAIDFILNNDRCGLFLDMGLGKTSITLTALQQLLMGLDIRKPLVIAPKRVTEHTWSTEIEKWDHLKGLRLSRITGDQRARIRALNAPADIYAISRDNIVWLVKHLLAQPRKIWPFDMLIIDELSSFKSPDSLRFKALKKVAPRCNRVVGLTGTPAANSLIDLWSQIFLLDQGVALERTLTAFRNKYCIAKYNGFGYDLKPGADKEIHERIQPLCISMRAADYLRLHQRVDVVERVAIAGKKAYDDFKRKEFLELSNGQDITPLSAAALYSKLLQFCNGAVYDETGAYHVVDSSKLDAVVEKYQELNGTPVLMFYQFRSDKERLLKAIPEAQMIESAEDIDRWNRGEIRCALAHGQSLGHGLNLQDGGRYMFWFGLPWSLEIFLQAVGRLDRQGQSGQVMNYMFIAEGTVEELVYRRLVDRTITQDTLIAALKKHIL